VAGLADLKKGVNDQCSTKCSELRRWRRIKEQTEGEKWEEKSESLNQQVDLRHGGCLLKRKKVNKSPGGPTGQER